MPAPNTNPKPPLWKQLLGALTGAIIAFVLYQAYTFTSSHLQAMNQSRSSSRVASRGFGSWQASVWPTDIQGSSASSSSAISIDDHVLVSQLVESEPQPPSPWPEPTPVPEESDSMVADIPPEESLHEAPDPIVAGVPQHSGQLPQSGFGLDLLAFTALGAVIGSRRMRRK